MTSNPRDQLRPGDEVFQALGWEGGPEFLDRDLAALLNIYATDPNTNFAAFETLAAIAGYWWSETTQVDRPDPNFGMPPNTPVTVPWWVVHLLGRCWRNYLIEPGKKAGEAFRLSEPALPSTTADWRAPTPSSKHSRAVVSNGCGGIRRRLQGRSGVLIVVSP